MRRPISLKVYSIALGLLVLMAVVTGLSARNLRILNNEVAALAGYYLPLDQQIGSVETLVRQQVVHLERILLLQARERDRFAIEQRQTRGQTRITIVFRPRRAEKIGCDSDAVTG